MFVLKRMTKIFVLDVQSSVGKYQELNQTKGTKCYFCYGSKNLLLNVWDAIIALAVICSKEHFTFGAANLAHVGHSFDVQLRNVDEL